MSSCFLLTSCPPGGGPGPGGDRGPGSVDLFVHYQSICAGDRHTCGVAGGEVFCFGRNAGGQLGDASGKDSLIGTEVVIKQTDSSAPPVLLTNARQVACRNNTSCAVTNDNVLYCWGYSWVGASLTIRLAAEKIADSVAQVAVGDGPHVCFVTTTGKVSCFGTNSIGQLGQAGADSATPVDVPGFPDTTSDPPNSHPAVEVTVGSIHSCARLDSGTVKCWGGNYHGQLGVPGPLGMGPTVVPNLKAKALAAGDQHTCAIGSDDVLRCWGDNESGQLGNGEACKDSAASVQVPTDDWARTLHPKAIAAADSHTCLVNDDEHVWCWGMDGTGQTGHHDFTARQTKHPSRVSYFLGDVGVVRDAKGITTGRWHSCALTKGGKLECWGRGDTGQLGDGGQEDSALPVPPVF